jgi:hypothetical protein
MGDVLAALKASYRLEFVCYIGDNYDLDMATVSRGTLQTFLTLSNGTIQ